MQQTSNLHVRDTRPLIRPRALRQLLPMTETASRTVVAARETVRRILQRLDPRLLVVVGPCSIHDVKAAREYAERLNALQPAVSDQFSIVMRVYFEKPRTTIGWKGLINDPHLDGSYDIEEGLKLARRLLLDLAEMGLPAATEVLDPIIPHYLADLISWAAIGARTTESQTHREVASGLSMPVGFKNATDGSLQIALDALGAAMRAHHFLGIDEDGMTSVIRTTGNPDGHVVLRGGRDRPNYDSESIQAATAALRKAGLAPVLMVDCSHANSGKQHAAQERVWDSVIAQRAEGNDSLVGLMIESNLDEGNQPFPQNPAGLRYGVSITDACVNWETTERMLRRGCDVLRQGKRDEAAIEVCPGAP
jgi:3-deoxy-7-phosphoheptulonate synthase